MEPVDVETLRLMLAGESVNAFLPIPELTNVAVDYDRRDEGFIVDSIAPVVPVTKDSFKYAKWGREGIKSIDQTARAIGAGANKASKISKTYITGTVLRYALKDDLADEILRQDPNPELLKKKKTEALARKLKIDREVRVKALLDATTNTAAVTNKWEQAATTTIEADIDTAREAFFLNSGVEPNWIIIPKLVANAIRRNTTIRQLIQYQPNDLLRTGQLPAPLLDMNVLIPGGISDTAAPGAATAAIGRLWGGKTCYLLFVDPESVADTLTAVLQFRETGGPDGVVPFGIKSWRDPDQSANVSWYSTELAQTEINVTPEAVYTLTGCIT